MIKNDLYACIFALQKLKQIWSKFKWVHSEFLDLGILVDFNSIQDCWIQKSCTNLLKTGGILSLENIAYIASNDITYLGEFITN